MRRESSRRWASMSYRAMVLSARAGVIMESPRTFLANTVLPAPIKVIFGIVLSSCERCFVFFAFS